MLSALPTFLVVYSLLYAAFGGQPPFLPELLSGRALHAEEIGIVLAASTAIRVLAGPAVGHVADRLRRHTVTLCACALVAAVAGLGYVMIRGFSGLLLVALVQAAMLAPKVPLSDALTTTAARRSETGEGRRFEYGWLRASRCRQHPPWLITLYARNHPDCRATANTRFPSLAHNSSPG
jgi:PPP family 3-phenylpropionic acid transporter